MSSKRLVLERVLSGRSDANVKFSDLRGLLRSLNFEKRVREVITFSRKTELRRS
jgi:hypothetical protein